MNKELLREKKLELEDLENSHPMILQKKTAPYALEGGPGAWPGNILLQITVRSFMDTTTRRYRVRIKMKQSCQTLGILQAEKWVNRAVWLQMGDPSEKGKMNLREKRLLPLQRQGPLLRTEVAACMGPEDRASSQEGLFSSQKIQWSLHC